MTVLESKSVGRPSPSIQVLERAFRMQVRRMQRRSDGRLPASASTTVL